MNQSELSFMKKAIDEAKRDSRPHKVGAVVVKDGVELAKAHGGEIFVKGHAEWTVLERKLSGEDLKGATLYTTLEPCTARYHPDRSCAEIIKERGMGRVVIGIPDPNPNIKRGGELFLKKHGIKVDYFPEELAKQIEGLMPDWIREQEAKRKYEELFSLLEDYRGPQISQYSGVAVLNTLSLRICPDITRGWLMSEVELRHETAKFPLPDEYRTLYDDYFVKFYNEKGFKTDNPKIMLHHHPRSFTDAPPLTLHTQETLYSHHLFYKDVVAVDPSKRDPLIQEIVVGEKRIANFPHTLCLHLVIITDDRKVLITKRAPDVEYYPNTWSSSLEENMALKDLEGGVEGAVLRWGKRALLEELGLTEDVYSTNNLRILSVFLESDILNISLCGHVILNISSAQLRKIIRGLPRMDYEFTAWDFLEYRDDELVADILHPSLPYHPTTRYRLLMALIKKNGIPSGAERFFR